MRAFDPNIILELAKEGFKFFLHLELEFASTYRYQNADIDIYYGGNKYTSRDFMFSGFEPSSSMGVDTVSLNLNDVEGTFKSIILNEDIRGKTANLGFFCLNASNVVVEFESLFIGLVNDWELKNSVATIELKNELIFWRKEVLRTCQSSCRWEFEGTECTYSGELLWCDQSYERCEFLSNEDNFGGFRWLPSIEDKDIWWGRVPDRSDE